MYTDLLFNLVRRELKLKYKGTVLGFFWSLLNPLLTLVTYGWVFGVLLKSSVPHYTMYLMASLIPWNFFSVTLTSSVRAYTDNSTLITKARFPRVILVYSTILFNGVVFAMTLLVVMVGMYVFHIPYTLRLLMLIPAIAVQLILSIGLGGILAAMNVRFHDTGHLVDILVMLWFWLTPVVYGWQSIPTKYVWLMSFNPFSFVVNLYQYAVLGQGLMVNTYISMGIIVIIVLIFALTYRRYASKIAEWI